VALVPNRGKAARSTAGIPANPGTIGDIAKATFVLIQFEQNDQPVAG
jgi:hypothetical protein